MARNTAVVIGIGAETPYGSGAEVLWKGLNSGESAIKTIDRFTDSPIYLDPDNVKKILESDSTLDEKFSELERMVETAKPKDFTVQYAGQLPPFDVKDFELAHQKEDNSVVRDIKKGRTDPLAIPMLKASHEALEDAGLFREGEKYSLDLKGRNLRAGVVLGTGIGGIQSLYSLYTTLLTKGPRKIDPFGIPKLMPNGIAGLASMVFGLNGPGYTTNSACSSAQTGIITSARIIENGEADVMLSGGGEMGVERLALAGFVNNRALATGYNDNPTEASRAFDRDHDGFVLAEGTAAIVLASKQYALEHGLKWYAEIVGWGETSDAGHITQPDPEAAMPAHAIRLAVEMAQIQYKLDQYAFHLYGSTHGTSTPLGDAMEDLAFRTALGNNAAKMAVFNAAKTYHGHGLGAAAGMELVGAFGVMNSNHVFPTLNLENQAPECLLNYNSIFQNPKGIDMEVLYMLKTSFGFGGHNTAILFKQPEQEHRRINPVLQYTD